MNQVLEEHKLPVSSLRVHRRGKRVLNLLDGNWRVLGSVGRRALFVRKDEEKKEKSKRKKKKEKKKKEKEKKEKEKNLSQGSKPAEKKKGVKPEQVVHSPRNPSVPPHWRQKSW